MSTLMLWLIVQVQNSAPASGSGLRLRDIREHWGGQQMIPTQWIMVAAGLLLLLIGGLSLYRLWRTRDQRSTPVLAFHRLAQQFGLSLRDQWLLYRIARQQALATPLTLMLTRDTLEHHVRAYVQACSPRRAERLNQRTHALAQSLFGPAPAASSSVVL